MECKESVHCLDYLFGLLESLAALASLHHRGVAKVKNVENLIRIRRVFTAPILGSHMNGCYTLVSHT